MYSEKDEDKKAIYVQMIHHKRAWDTKMSGYDFLCLPVV